MQTFLRVFAILLADVRERTRSPRFWIVLGLMAYATWWCFPDVHSGYITLALMDHSRGLYSSAWMGMGLGLIYSSLLNLVGFYLVRGTLTRDFDTRVWQLLVTTPMTRAGYLFAKWLSHMAVFAAIATVSLVVAAAAQWVRAEDRHFDLIELAKPLLVLATPSLGLTAAFAIWFDLVPWLRRTAGNVLYFFLWVTLLTVPLVRYEGVKHIDPQGWSSDPAGMLVAAREIGHVREAQTGKPLPLGLNLGGIPVEGGPQRFEWKAWSPPSVMLIGRALWLALSVLLAIGVAPLLDWAASRGLSAARSGDRAGRRLRAIDWLLAPFARGPLGILTVAELKLALRQRRVWWWLAAIGVIGAQCAPMPAMQIGLLLAWLLPLDVLAHAALREREHATGALVFTAPSILARLFGARALSGIALLALLSAPSLLRLASSAPISALALGVVIVSLTAWGLAFGALCRNARPFEMLMVGTVYVCLQGGTLLDVVHAPLRTLQVHGIGLALAGVLLAWAWPRLARR